MRVNAKQTFLINSHCDYRARLILGRRVVNYALLLLRIFLYLPDDAGGFGNESAGDEVVIPTGIIYEGGGSLY